MMITWALVLASTLTLSSCQVNDGACLRFGGGACCPHFKQIERDLQESVENQPIYIKFLPKNEDTVNLDNVCYTFFPIPESPDSYLVYVSRVYCDGQNQIRSFIITERETGVHSYGNGLCHFVSTIIADVPDCDMRISHRCITGGECPFVEAFDSPSGLIGTSNSRKPISHACIVRVANVAKIQGLPSDEYHILPMRLPSRCVTNRVCSVLPTVQRFCQTIGVAFPNLNCEQRFF